MNNKIIISKTESIQYCLIFLFMLVHGNRFLTLYNDIILLFILFIGLISIILNKGIFKKQDLKMILLLALSMMFVAIITDGSLMLTTILMVLSRFVIAFLAFRIDEKKFVHRFVEFTYFIAIISLIGFTLVQLIPETLKDIFPQYTYYYRSPWSGLEIPRPTYFALLFQFRADSDISRNIGMFNESGLYQIILNLSLYLLLFHKEKLYFSNSYRKKVFYVLLITLITVQSATGLIALMILFLGYTFSENMIYRWKALSISLFIIMIIIIYISSVGNESLIYQNILKKFITENGNIDLMNSTGKSRIVSMIADIQIFLNNPLGSGTQYYASIWKNSLGDFISDSSSPVGFTNSLAVYGIFPVSIIWGFYLKNKWINRKSVADFLTCIVIIINTTLAQPSIFFPSFIVMCLIKNNYDILITNKGED